MYGNRKYTNVRYNFERKVQVERPGFEALDFVLILLILAAAIATIIILLV